MSVLPEPDLRSRLRLLLADRRSPEARALFGELMCYVNKRVHNVTRSRPLAAATRDEIVSEVMLQLIRGSLARFRGESLPELFGFVRTITDRTTWRIVRSAQREAAAVDSMTNEDMSWNASFARPDEHIELVAESPLPEADQAYLQALLYAGTKAELARQSGVSRAAVTQRIQRIRARIGSLARNERMAHEAWMTQKARATIEEQAEARLHSN